MRTLKISLLVFILSITMSAQWAPEHWDISFVNPNTGWVVGEYGGVFHTTDGGTSWITQSTGSNDYLLGVFFINESNGWIVGTPTNEQTIILNTTDGGNSWNYQFNEPTGALYSIFFVDENNGWATGNYGIILHTSNGGTSWNYQISGATFTLFDVFFTDINNGWITGSSTLHTTNGGSTWNLQISYGYLDICFADSNNGWIPARTDVIHTTDSGNNWFSLITVPSGNYLYGLDFLDINNGWVVGGGGYIIHTTDSGISWISQKVAPKFRLRKVEFVDENNGWAVGRDKAILHTSNGGQDWIPQMYSSNEWFDDYFDSYLEEIPLACQNLDEWTTWNNSPCDFFEDPEISSIYSYSYPNSCRIITNNNLVRFHYGSTTDGNYVISFRLYIPNGKKGYYNIMSEFMYGVGGYKAVEVYFDQGGNGRLLTSDTTNFSYTYDVWQEAEIIVNLNDDIASFIFDGYAINTWQWTQGAGGGIGPKSLEAINFYGLTPDIEMYIDNFEDYLWWVPVELVSFTANVQSGGVILNWSTATETNNSGFEILRTTKDDEWNTMGFVPGHGTTTETQHYSFTDNDVRPDKYQYKLKQIDYDGSFEYSQVVKVEVSFVNEFALSQNYPNPYNSSTVIKYSIPQSAQVVIKVFDILGNEIETLVNEEKPTGTYELTWTAENLPSSIYFYRIQAGSFIDTKKMILLK